VCRARRRFALRHRGNWLRSGIRCSGRRDLSRHADCRAGHRAIAPQGSLGSGRSNLVNRGCECARFEFTSDRYGRHSDCGVRVSECASLQRCSSTVERRLSNSRSGVCSVRRGVQPVVCRRRSSWPHGRNQCRLRQSSVVVYCRLRRVGVRDVIQWVWRSLANTQHCEPGISPRCRI